MRHLLTFYSVGFGSMVLLAEWAAHKSSLRKFWSWLKFRRLCNWNLTHNTNKTLGGNPFIPNTKLFRRLISHGVCHQCCDVELAKHGLKRPTK